MKKFSKIIPPLLMYVVIAVEFLFINTTGNYIYSRYYDNIVLKTLLTLSFLIFPILSVLFLNRCFCGKSYSKNKIFNIGLMLIITLIVTVIYIIIKYQTDTEFNCIIAGFYCIWIIAFLTIIMISYWIELKKDSVRNRN